MENAASWKYEARKFAAVGNLHEVELCRVSGGVATDACRAAGMQYRVKLPGEMIPHAYCAVDGGQLAGLSTDAPVTPAVAAAAPVGETFAQEIPVARAEPANATPAESSGENWRMIRKERGFIFINSP